MKNAEIRDLAQEEILETIKQEEEKMVKMRFAHKISPLENPTVLNSSRRLLARLKTILKEKEAKNA